MPAFVDARQLNPLVQLDVVDLHSIGCLVHFLPGSRNNNIAVQNSAARVPMPRVVHSLFFEELQVVGARIVLIDQFAALEHAIRQSLVVSATYHEYTWLMDADLDHLEIVREVPFEVHKFVHAVLILNVVNRHCSRVFLEDVELGWEA